MLESSHGIERKKIVKIFTMIVILITATGLFLHASMIKPNVESVNGVYRSECCGVIIIENGLVRYRNVVKKLDLENMKFGLTGYVQGVFTRNGIQSSDEKTAISFYESTNGRTLSVSIDGNNETFDLSNGLQ